MSDNRKDDDMNKINFIIRPTKFSNITSEVDTIYSSSGEKKMENRKGPPMDHILDKEGKIFIPIAEKKRHT
jgi:hypothetical protein